MRTFVMLSVLTIAGAAMAQDHSHDMPMSSADHAMSMHEMHSTAHMHMTTLRALAAGDRQRADAIVQSARAVMAKYADYKVAEADGFQPFLPKLKQPMVHFTNYKYGLEAGFHFNPDHPTSLLYEPLDGGGYRLIGVMYTAPFRFSEDQLNERVPLSIAQWHLHTNLCVAPWGHRAGYFGDHPEFGLNGSIATQDACQAAGGTFHEHVLGWMVHVYANESDPARIWSVERQMPGMD